MQLGNLQSIFQFSCNQNTPYGNYLLSMVKTNDGNYYTELPILSINVTYLPVKFQFTVSSFSIPVGSSSFIIYETVPTQMPDEYIILSFSLNSNDSGLTLNQNSIRLDKTYQYGFISISSINNQSMIGSNVDMEVSISGPNANSYVLSTNSFTLNIISNYTYDLTASISPNQNPDKVLTSSFSMTCSVQGIGYYQMMKSSCGFNGINNVISNVKSFYVFTTYDLCQNQYGAIYFESDNTQKTVTINNIRSNKNYTI